MFLDQQLNSWTRQEVSVLCHWFTRSQKDGRCRLPPNQKTKKCRSKRCVCIFWRVWVFLFDFLFLERMEHHGPEWAGHESRKTPFLKWGPLDVLVISEMKKLELALKLCIVARGISAEVVTSDFGLFAWFACWWIFVSQHAKPKDGAIYGEGELQLFSVRAGNEFSAMFFCLVFATKDLPVSWISRGNCTWYTWVTNGKQV